MLPKSNMADETRGFFIEFPHLPCLELRISTGTRRMNVRWRRPPMSNACRCLKRAWPLGFRARFTIFHMSFNHFSCFFNEASTCILLDSRVISSNNDINDPNVQRWSTLTAKPHIYAHKVDVSIAFEL